MQIKITSKNGITLKTKGKFVNDDINILVDEKLFEQPNKVYADGVEVYGYDENGNKYLVVYEEVA